MMEFPENKYARWYRAIVEKHQATSHEGTVERHHIVPKSLGGSNDAANIVRLPSRTHFVCHRLLARMFAQGTRERQKMSLALHKMAYGTNASKYSVSSHAYESIRKLSAEAVRSFQLERFKDPVVRQKQRELAKHASDVAAQKLRDDPAHAAQMHERQSERTQLRVKAGTHNFISGEIQRNSWKSEECREKHRQHMTSLIENGTHVFQQPEFIEAQRMKLKERWANMTPEQHAERCRKISEGRHAKRLKKAQEA